MAMALMAHLAYKSEERVSMQNYKLKSHCPTKMAMSFQCHDQRDKHVVSCSQLHPSLLYFVKAMLMKMLVIHRSNKTVMSIVSSTYMYSWSSFS